MANKPPSAPTSALNILYSFMVLAQVILIVEFFVVPQNMGFAGALFNLIENQRSGLILLQLFGCAILFVDAVVRFDHLKNQWIHCIGIGLLACHWMFQMFVHFLSSSYLT